MAILVCGHIAETKSTYIMIDFTLRFDDVGIVPGLLLLLWVVQRSRMLSRKWSERWPGNEATCVHVCMCDGVCLYYVLYCVCICMTLCIYIAMYVESIRIYHSCTLLCCLLINAHSLLVHGSSKKSSIYCALTVIIASPLNLALA